MSALYKFCCVLLFLMATIAGFTPATPAHAANYTAIQSGFWSNTATWGGIVPTSADNVTIPLGITVTIAAPVVLDAGATLTINGVLNNTSTLSSLGLINNNLAAIFSNTGLLESNALNNYGTFYTNGTVQDYGYFDNKAGAILDNYGLFSMETDATFDNDGGLINYVGATFEDRGLLLNDVGATLTNNGTLTIYAAAALNNYGILNNNAGATLLNNGSLTNAVGGTLENYGTVNNNSAFTNNGVVNNHCIGALNGNAVIGTPANNIADCPTATPTSTSAGCVNSATAPNLISPVHRVHTTDHTPNFSWNSVSGAQSYRVMVYLEDRSFEYKKRVFVPNYTLTTAEALTPAKYLWRVRTQDTLCSTWTAWSGRNTLFVD